MPDTRTSTTLVAAILAGALAACGGDGGAGGEAGAGAQPAGGEPQAAAPIANAGTITGMINFAGTPPANAAIDMSAEPTCAAQHAGGTTEETVIASNGKLANVFVYIREGITGSFAPPAQPVEVDQVGCHYTPHVIGVMAGQGVAFKNSDGLLHNVKAQPKNNRPFNISQPTSMTSSPQRFSTPEVMIPVQCDVHGWMQMYVGVVAHPYFAVSGADGSFTIGNVPPGTYAVEAWHEKYGVQVTQITVDPNGTATVAFDYNASMAANAVVPLGAPFDPHDHGPAGHDAVKVTLATTAAR